MKPSQTQSKDSAIKFLERKFNVPYDRVIIDLSNTLYKIDYDEKDKKLLWKSLRKNKDFLKSMNISKKQFTLSVMNIVSLALNLKYKTNST